MAQIELNSRTVGDLDGGRAEHVINAALGSVLADLDDRGDDEKPRKVKIELTFTKKRNVLSTDVKVATTIPAYQTDITVSEIHQKPGRKGGVRPALVFQEHDPDNPQQETFPAMDGKSN